MIRMPLLLWSGPQCPFEANAQPDNAELKNEKRAIPQCFEESPHLVGIIKRYRKWPSSRKEQWFGLPMMT
jgi:hypothetical protein